jgi:alpha-ribazole phosphatase
VILVRHPKPDCEPGLCYGHLDLACDAADLERIASELAPVAAGALIVSSPLRRALDLARRLHPEPRIEPRLRELDFGAWEGIRWSDLGREAIDAWRAGLPDAAPPGGETVRALAARCEAWLADLALTDSPVLAITHAGPIRILRALTEGLPLLSLFQTPVAYGKPLELRISR